MTFGQVSYSLLKLRCANVALILLGQVIFHMMVNQERSL